MKTIVWGNYKGGVGKTTSTFQVAHHFASNGKKVLLLDLDPQASLSNICCSANAQCQLSSIKAEQTVNFLFELYIRLTLNDSSVGMKMLEDPKHTTSVSRFVSHVVHPIKDNLAFLPTSISFPNARINDLAQKMALNLDNIFTIQLLINDLSCLEYDYLFIDCPPTSNIITQSAFLSSDYYIVPTIIDEISANGVADYIAEIERTRLRFTYNEAFGGIIIDRVFGEKSKLIGVFETLYKERRGDADNRDQILVLDQNIDKVVGVPPIIADNNCASFRYSQPIHGFNTKNIFYSYIPHKDNRSGRESIAKNTSQGKITPSYEEISGNLLSII